MIIVILRWKMGKPKNLNRDSQREFLIQQRKMIDDQLKQEIVLYKDDLESLYVKYEKSLHEHEFAHKTQSKYLRNARWFIDRYSTSQRPITKDDTIKFKQDLLSKYKKTSTINSYITTINRFLYFCDLRELAVEDEKSQSTNVIDSRIYDHELKRMLRKAKANNEMELYYLMRLLSETGIRIAERTHFTSEVIYKGLTVQVHNKGKWRTVPVPQSLMRDLRKWSKKEGLEGPLFKLSYDSIYAGLKRIAGSCKINKSKISPHQFRHYFAYRFIEVNGEAFLSVLADILGHTSIATTAVYVRGTSEDYRKRMEAMV